MATPTVFSWKLTRQSVTVGSARDVYVVFLLLRQGANLLDLAPAQTGIVMEVTLAAANGQIVLLEVPQLLQVVVIDDRHTVPVATPAKEKCKENSVNTSPERVTTFPGQDVQLVEILLIPGHVAQVA